MIPRILVYRLGSLGDTIIVLPCLNALRAKFPEARITLLTNVPIQSKAAPMMAVLENSGLIDAVLPYPVGTRDFKKLWMLRSQIAEQDFSLAIHLAAPRGQFCSARDWLFLKWSGIPKIIGVPWHKEDLHACKHPGSQSYEWEADRLARRLQATTSVSLNDESLWDLHLTQNEWDTGQQLLASHGIDTKFIACSIGTKLQSKDWGADNWCRFGEMLGNRLPDYAVVAIGSKDEFEQTEDFLSCCNNNQKANLCGSSAPRVSAGVLKRASLFVGHDSGPMHLAASVGTPCVAIFSSRNLPGEWLPRGGDRNTIFYRQIDCQGCGLDVCIERKKACILSITPEEVVDAVFNHLRK